MSLKRQLKIIHLLHVSKPEVDRAIYRAIYKRRVRKIVEFGIGMGQRAVRMIEVAQVHSPIAQVSYTGIDLFESRTSQHGPGVPLKLAHRLLKATKAQVHLVPGDPFWALSRAANGLAGTELAVVSAELDPASLARAWFYFPRMLGQGALVLMQEAPSSGKSGGFRAITGDEIARLAGVATPIRRAA